MPLRRTRGSVPEVPKSGTGQGVSLLPGATRDNGWMSWPSIFRAASINDSMRVSAVYACARNICEDIGKLRVDVYSVERDQYDNIRRKVAIRHPLRILLKKPNRYQDNFQFIETIMMALVMRGNSYVAIMRDRAGRPAALIPVHPDRVTIVEADDGELFYRVSKGSRFENAQIGDLMNIPERDVIHIRGLSGNGLVGLSPLEFAAHTVGFALTSEEYQSRFFSRGARPSGALKHPEKISKEAADRLKVDWESAYGGMENTGKTVLLEEGMEYQSLSMTSVDAEFLSTRKFTVEEIARIFRVPLHKIGQLDRSTNNNIAAQDISYINDTLSPYIERIETAFELKFDMGDNYEMLFDVWSLMRMDMVALSTAMRTLKMGGLISTNEGRMRLGLNPRDEPEHDVVNQPLNMGDPKDIAAQDGQIDSEPQNDA